MKANFQGVTRQRSAQLLTAVGIGSGYKDKYMPNIELATEIFAPIERCFDLARSIKLHPHSLQSSGEKTIAGVTSGLISMDQEVTWSTRHFGISQKLTSRNTGFDRPSHFRDSMVHGAFHRFDHEHYFSFRNGRITVRDVSDFNSPHGIVGRFFDHIVVKQCMRRLLCVRNSVLKLIAESRDEWKLYLSEV